MRICALLALTGLAAVPGRATRAVEPLTVHEWGTFTSVAGEDGRALRWRPLDGPPDLPEFVDRLRVNIKGSLVGRVRMETPVLYFYAPHETTVNVTVRFRQGLVTEWFPRANVTPGSVAYSGYGSPDFSSSISWPDVHVWPRAAADFPTDESDSHYFVARETDASPLQVGSEKERFLFYRGVGDFAPPIAATIDAGGRIAVRNPSGAPLGDVILFDNDGGQMAYDVRHAETPELTFDPSSRDRENAPSHAKLDEILIARGLYPKEARAMVATWRDSWFEEGTRIFYVVPRPAIDAILPLEISPAPTEVARVFVGRLELLTPRTPRRFRQAR
jgi:hypothetical protein